MYPALLAAAGLLLPLIVVQRRLHAEIQLLFLLLTRRADLATALFSILFFPGVLLHEGAHLIAARLLGVRTGRISLLPKSLPGGRLQMGYVETEAVDPLREALIGAAPLLAGGLFTAYAGLHPLGLPDLWSIARELGVSAAAAALPGMTSRSDFWIWLYLTFVVSSMMLPSPSDRRAWLPVAALVTAAAGLAVVAGAGPWAAEHLAPLLERGLRALGLVFGISLGLHLAILAPIHLLRRAAASLLGLEVRRAS